MCFWAYVLQASKKRPVPYILQGTSGLVLKDSTLYGKLVLKRKLVKNLASQPKHFQLLSLPLGSLLRLFEGDASHEAASYPCVFAACTVHVVVFCPKASNNACFYSAVKGVGVAEDLHCSTHKRIFLSHIATALPRI
jgi:hypothetical protein